MQRRSELDFPNKVALDLSIIMYHLYTSIITDKKDKKKEEVPPPPTKGVYIFPNGDKYGEQSEEHRTLVLHIINK